MLAASMVLFLMLAVKVAIKIQITNTGYSLAQEEQRAVLLDNERRDLELQLSILNRHDALERRVKETLGLQSFNPARTRYIYR